MPVDLTVLSVRQPWAALIITGEKWCENRSWTSDYRGPLWIHASQTFGREDREECEPYGIDPGSLTCGAIIGCAELVEILHIDDMTPARERGLIREHGLDPAGKSHVGGEWCWILARPRALVRPISLPGKLRLWNYRASPAEIAELQTAAPIAGTAGDQESKGNRRRSESAVREYTEKVKVDGRSETVTFTGNQHGVGMTFKRRGRMRIARGPEEWQYVRGEPYYRAGCEKAWELFPEAFTTPSPLFRVPVKTKRKRK